MSRQPVDSPKGNFLDTDLYLNTVDILWLGEVALAKAMRRSTGLPAFPVLWDVRKIGKKITPQETDEQSVVVSIMKGAGAKLCSIPNGGFRHTETAVKMKREGMSVGAPDLIIWGGLQVEGAVTKPPITAIEMKKAGGLLSDFSKEQTKWLEYIHTETTAHAVGAFGSSAALAYLGSVGYETRRG